MEVINDASPPGRSSSSASLQSAATLAPGSARWRRSSFVGWRAGHCRAPEWRYVLDLSEMKWLLVACPLT